MSKFHLCTDKVLLPSQREIEVVLNSTHDAMIAVNEQGIINIFNAAAERILGVLVQEALGQSLDKIVPNSLLRVVLETGVSQINQQHEIGNVRVVTNRVPVRDENNNVIGAVAVFRDITEVEQLAEELTNLKEIQEMLMAIINSSQDVISVVDDKGRISLVNPAYTRLVGMSRDEVLGKPPTVDIQQGESMHLHSLRTKQPVRGVPMRVGPQNKEVIVNAAPIIVNDRLRGSVAVAHDVSEIKRLTAELDQMKSLVRRIKNGYTFDDIIGDSSTLKSALDLAVKAATTPATVLLTGESGTGKELFAHSIHNASNRKNGPFIRINCAAIPETLLESELFGYAEGAFTGARKGGKKGLFVEADQGTIFLDEIGEIAPSVQAKLLRVLQEREVVPVGGVKSVCINVRIIAATNVDLKRAVSKGSFREDLYYRINVFPIPIPPLRDRLEDLPDLTEFLLEKLAREYGRKKPCADQTALQVLSHYDWPGNVRELENVLGRALINMRPTEDLIMVQHLPQLAATVKATQSETGCPSASSLQAGKTLAEIVEEAEYKAIQSAIAACGGSRTAAARQLGIAVRSLYYKLEKYKHNLK